MNTPFRRVAVVGLGLMGGSLARALKALAHPPHVVGFSGHPWEVERAGQEGFIDNESGTAEALLPDRDLVVYACPPATALELLVAHAPLLGPEATVTDVVSLKGPLHRKARESGLGSRFVGSHPMAGGTGSGLGASRDDLYHEARVWITPGAADEARIERVEAFWATLGARPERTTAQAHDEMMAWVSHLPQLTSNAMALALARAGFSPSQLGPGGRDMSRLAGSGTGMWRGILEERDGSILTALEAVEETLRAFRESLAHGNMDEIEGLMSESARWLEEEG